MIVGATQIQTYISCKRQWWFAHVAGMSAGKGAAYYGQLFGTVLHGVVERWLKADQQGRGPDGQPVNLYPPGWQWCPEKLARVTPEDERIIKKVVNKAAADGVLERIPRRKIEQKFYALVQPEPAAFGSVPLLQIVGTVDYMAPGMVIDHKGIKDQGYRLVENPESDNYLGKNFQVRLYARAMQNQFNIPHDKDVILRHNYYNRITGEVSKRQVTVTGRAIQKTVNKAFRLAKEMHGWAQTPRGDGSKKGQGNYKTIPAAIDGDGAGAKACNGYGGCPYLSVCLGSKSVDTYRTNKLRERLPAQAGKDFDMAKNTENPFDDDDEDEKPAKKAKKVEAEDDDDDEDEKPAKKAKEKTDEEKVNLAAKVKLPVLEILGLTAKSFTSLTAANLAERLLCIRMQLDGITLADLKAACAAKEAT